MVTLPGHSAFRYACHDPRPCTRWVVREATTPGLPRPRLLDRVLGALRARHYSPRTEDAYVAWIDTHVLNRGPAGVRSPADRMFGL